MRTITKPQAAGPCVASPVPAVLPPAARERGGLARDVLACLASGPKSRVEIREIVGCDPWAVHRALGKLVRTGAAVEVGNGRYGAVPEAQARIDDPALLGRIILAFLAVPRRIGEVARHTGVPHGLVRSRVDALVCTGQAAKAGRGLYVATGRPRAVPGVPSAAPIGALQLAAAADPRRDPGLPEHAAPGAGRRRPYRPARVDRHGPPRGDAAAGAGGPHRPWPLRAGGADGRPGAPAVPCRTA